MIKRACSAKDRYAESITIESDRSFPRAFPSNIALDGTSSPRYRSQSEPGKNKMEGMAETTAQGKPQIEEARADFAARFPDFEKTSALDELRATEYRRLDERGQVYLDYTGGSLYAESQLQKHFDLLRTEVMGNPHSASPASVAMTEHVERTRRRILNYFNARSEDYILVFTQNASAALKLVGESFVFGSGSRYLLTFDN